MDAPLMDQFKWLDPKQFRRVEQAREDLANIWVCGATPDLLDILKNQLLGQLAKIDDRDAAISNLSRFVSASRSPTSLLALFERDLDALPHLLQIFSTSHSLASRLIADPESFDLLRASDGQPTKRKILIDELVSEIDSIENPERAKARIHNFIDRETMRVAYGEFVRGLTPDKVGRQLAHIADAAIEASLRFAIRKLNSERGEPTLSSGESPQVTVIGLGNLGGEELGYGNPLKLVFLFDRIDYLNKSHRDYYATLVTEVIKMLTNNDVGGFGYSVDSRDSPMFDTGTLICSVRDAARIYESSGQTWQRLSFVKARTVGGAIELGQRFLDQLEPWIFRRYMSRDGLSAFSSVREKLLRRTSQPIEQQSSGQENSTTTTDDVVDIVRDPGGRQDIELTIQFVQLLHGGDLEDVRSKNTVEALIALERSGCLTHQEASLLIDNYARLCRLQHQLSVMFDCAGGRLPSDAELCRRLAFQLGIQTADGSHGDLEKFQKMLADTLQVNRKIINHLLLDTPESDGHVSLLTALVLDPDPDPQLVKSTLSSLRLSNPQRALDNLLALSRETVSFLSPQRCRQFFSVLAPQLLQEISATPDPDRTLASLVSVTDSLGAKAMLWELMRANPPTMQLMVRLCAAAPYLTSILTSHPGMIDELIDSLLMNRLPRQAKIEAQSIELCRGAQDPLLILKNIKNSMHLTIGVRDILGKESVESLHQALSDTAESCLRRLCEYEQEKLAAQYGDPVDENGEPSQLLMLALGKLGGREPNYHSDLDVVFLYSAEGETQRRVGGPRKTTNNQHFFNVVAQRVHQCVNRMDAGGKLYDLDGRLRPTGNEGVLAVSIETFLKRFRQGIAPLWQRMAICKARSISGSGELRRQTDRAIVKLITESTWHDGIAIETRELRQQNEITASEDNLKRGRGGTVDVEVIAQMLTLRYASESPQIIVPRTVDSLQALADAGHLDETDAVKLITSYRVLRRVEANLRLLDHRSRHELPSDERTLRDLAYLMGESDPNMVLAQCQTARQTNRAIFDKYVGTK